MGGKPPIFYVGFPKEEVSSGVQSVLVVRYSRLAGCTGTTMRPVGRILMNCRAQSVMLEAGWFRFFMGET